MFNYTCMSFPKIEGLRWLAEDFPDLVAIKITLVNRKLQDLDIPGMAIPETDGEMHVDLSKLAAVHHWYPKGEDEPSKGECSVDIEGVNGFIADISVENLIEAWIFYKRFKYAHDTRNI